MRNHVLFLIAFAILFSGEALAQDIHAIFHNKLTLDNNLSNQTKALDGLMGIYGGVQTKIYSYQGSFQEAVNTMKVPDNSNVSTVTDQSLGSSISMLLLFHENLDSKPMNEAWYETARKKVKEYENTMGKSLSVTINPSQTQNPENLSVGEKIEMRIISLSNPYIDFDNLQVVEGTWVSETLVSTIVTQDMLESEGFEDGWDEEEMDMDVELPAGAHFVSFDDVADSEWLQGDVNYLVEMSTDQAVDFFKKGQKRFVNNFEQSESYSQEGDMIMISYFYLLKHQGDLKVGDDVVSMTIQPAPNSILADALGRNQGTWTLISISRWTEEDY